MSNCTMANLERLESSTWSVKGLVKDCCDTRRHMAAWAKRGVVGDVPQRVVLTALPQHEVPCVCQVGSLLSAHQRPPARRWSGQSARPAPARRLPALQQARESSPDG